MKRLRNLNRLYFFLLFPDGTRRYYKLYCPHKKDRLNYNFLSKVFYCKILNLGGFRVYEKKLKVRTGAEMPLKP